MISCSLYRVLHSLLLLSLVVGNLLPIFFLFDSHNPTEVLSLNVNKILKKLYRRNIDKGNRAWEIYIFLFLYYLTLNIQSSSQSLCFFYYDLILDIFVSCFALVCLERGLTMERKIERWNKLILGKAWDSSVNYRRKFCMDSLKDLCALFCFAGNKDNSLKHVPC